MWTAFYKNALRTEFKGTMTAKTCQRMKWKRILGSSIQRPRLSKWIVWLTFIPPPSPPPPPGSQTIYFHEIDFFSSTARKGPWPIFEYKETTFPVGSLTVTAAASIYGPDNNSSDLSNMSKMHKQVPRLQQTDGDDDDLVKNAQTGHKIWDAICHLASWIIGSKALGVSEG